MGKDLHLVSESILKEIQRKRSILQQHPEYHLWKLKHADYFKSESIRHSVSLELDGFDGANGMGCCERAKERALSEKFLRGAFEWGGSNYRGFLDYDYLEEIGRRVDPRVKVKDKKKNAEGFRGDRDFVTIVGAPWTPVSPQLLKREIDFFCFENNMIQDPIEKAVHAQFHLIRIHPLNDGNGRLGRATTNIILERAGFPLISVPLREKVEYASLLNEAVPSFVQKDFPRPDSIGRHYEEIISALNTARMVPKNFDYYCHLVKAITKYRMTSQQGEFYDYLALKVRDALDSCHQKLSDKKRKRFFNRVFW